jgi:hypothetical protein
MGFIPIFLTLGGFIMLFIILVDTSMKNKMKAFEENERIETYRDTDDQFIALRYGPDRDCLMVFELGEEVAFLHNIMSKARKLILIDE